MPKKPEITPRPPQFRYKPSDYIDKESYDRAVQFLLNSCVISKMRYHIAIGDDIEKNKTACGEHFRASMNSRYIWNDIPKTLRCVRCNRVVDKLMVVLESIKTREDERFGYHDDPL